ncbi:MAG: hypothetical protein HQK91_06445 [Nitrospirae bacterium]|nr:hypothetical protein [Nitrospirota bacterium]
MDAKDFLKLAKRLYDSYNDEASLRTVISRSYLNCGLFYKKAEMFFKDFENLDKTELLKDIDGFIKKSNN